MTDPRSIAFYPEYPEEQAKADAWRASLRSRGWTEESAPEVRPITIWHLRKPLPSLPAPLGPSEHGVDVSRYQGEIDWPRVRADGYRFAYVKVSQGVDYLDPRGRANRDGAYAAGMHVGAYHYFEHDRDGEAQARHFSAAIGEDVPRLTPAVDFETSGQPRVPAQWDKTTITVQLKRFLDTLVSLLPPGADKPVIYTNRASIDAMTTRPAWLADYPLWLADWTPPMNVPAPWTWARFWQKGKRPVAGVVDECDYNEYLGDTPPPMPSFPMRDKTNQFVINLFWTVFGSFSQLGAVVPGWSTSMAANSTTRNALYTGPAVEAMPLTPAEKAALIAALST